MVSTEISCDIWGWNVLFLSYVFNNLFIHLFFIFVCTGSSLLQSFSSCTGQGLLFTVVCGLLLLQSMGSRPTGFSSWQFVGSIGFGLSTCAWTQLPRGMWNPPGPGIEPMPPASVGGFPSRVPPGKSP